MSARARAGRSSVVHDLIERFGAFVFLSARQHSFGRKQGPQSSLRKFNWFTLVGQRGLAFKIEDRQLAVFVSIDLEMLLEL